jgi:hypothetical protein
MLIELQASFGLPISPAKRRGACWVTRRRRVETLLDQRYLPLGEIADAWFARGSETIRVELVPEQARFLRVGFVSRFGRCIVRAPASRSGFAGGHRRFDWLRAGLSQSKDDTFRYSI